MLAFRASADNLRSALDAYGDALVYEAVTGRLDLSRISETQSEERMQAAIEGRLDEVAV